MENDAIAELASLRYYNDQFPGITRKRNGNTFQYFYPDGKRVVEQNVLERIKKLAIPPAYSEVWISTKANSHLQATGRDAKNRKQYRYHKKWESIRQQNKFMMLLPFGQALTKIRKHTEKVLKNPLHLNKEQIICAIIFLLDNYFIRIGNYIYEKQNKSFGLTTLRKKHLSWKSTQAILEFEGKNSKSWHVVLKDKKILKILKKCEEIPGYHLFKYLDEDNISHEISSQDVNEYLKQITQQDFTAKDFRTWAACRETLFRLVSIEYDEGSNSTFKEIVTDVASLLGHTPAICQKSYIYPEIIAMWKDKKLIAWHKKTITTTVDKDSLLLQWLEEHLQLDE